MNLLDLLVILATTEALSGPQASRMARAWDRFLLPSDGDDEAAERQALRARLEVAPPCEVRRWAYRVTRAALVPTSDIAKTWDFQVSEELFGLGRAVVPLGFGADELPVNVVEFDDDVTTWRALALGAVVVALGVPRHRARHEALRIYRGLLAAREMENEAEAHRLAVLLLRVVLTENVPSRQVAWAEGGGD